MELQTDKFVLRFDGYNSVDFNTDLQLSINEKCNRNTMSFDFSDAVPFHIWLSYNDKWKCQYGGSDAPVDEFI